MRQRDKAGGKATTTQRSKRRAAPQAGCRGSSLGDGKETSVARLTRERDEALEQLTATSEVLKVISSCRRREPVFQAMLANAVRICEAKFGVLFRYDGSDFYLAAWVGVPPAYEESLRQRGLFRPEADAPLDRLLQRKEVVHTADELAEPNPQPCRQVWRRTVFDRRAYV